MLNRFLLAAVAAALAAAPVLAQGAGPGHRLGQANYYLAEFEKEVALQRGGEKAVWRNKKDALTRVQALKVEFPDDPEVERLYQRARRALMRSMGQLNEVDPSWTLYKRNEENLRKMVAAEGEACWKGLLASAGTNWLERPFPAPDTEAVAADAVTNRLVVLDGVRYPMDQFYGGTGEYIACGKPSEGFYFVEIGGRNWLGPYEAVKRYRRNVDTGLEDVQSWTVLGRITGVTAEIPSAGEEKVGSVQFGWVVQPIALQVPGHVVAFHDAGAPSSGRFAGEEKAIQAKADWFTVREIPADVTPERLMEIFMTAIKEKNYDLYVRCVNPDCLKTPVGTDLLKYHWDLHQSRFHNEYVHATFSKATYRVLKGFDSGDELNNFFLDDAQKAKLVKAQGVKVEEATVESRAIDENGKQLGSPHPHRLIRKGGGRWYVQDYAPRF